MVTAKSLKVLIASAIVADDVPQPIRELIGRGSWRDLAHSDSFARFTDPLGSAAGLRSSSASMMVCC
ncbi:hypothetical protein [Nocardia cyriacigeorgica]|uniref:hypothetical protein n=1 Tax=Nocardia cyriacigeorgica TaxID=135487 RepID=UPI0018963326|nr:hypothetical protein [Nocardia cyriacigeorgica]MBF6157363.1 hypothetical protein [Nocardia cyriacigeorgica]MBF6196334.1 hypothetical protein [Nocardia cyriacigeorgica]